jgi:hypothetical protein
MVDETFASYRLSAACHTPFWEVTIFNQAGYQMVSKVGIIRSYNLQVALAHARLVIRNDELGQEELRPIL